jgi:hypothetical protein
MRTVWIREIGTSVWADMTVADSSTKQAAGFIPGIVDRDYSSADVTNWTRVLKRTGQGMTTFVSPCFPMLLCHGRCHSFKIHPHYQHGALGILVFVGSHCDQVVGKADVMAIHSS